MFFQPIQYRNTTYAADVFDTYYFEKNLQGDIIAVYTDAGRKIGSYTYDAWGNVTVSYASGATTVEKRIVRNYNPFRYRGYYYDIETGLYYLQSRYYDPTMGRFINADGYVNANGDILGYNIFAYCSNNPIMFVDLSGEGKIWDWISSKASAVVEWVDDTIVKPTLAFTIEATFAVVDTLDPDNNINTLQFGWSFSAGCGAEFSHSWGIAFDREGNIGRYHTVGLGGSAGCGISKNFTITTSNASTIADLSGGSFSMGGSVGVPVYGPISVGVGYEFGQCFNGYTTNTYSVGCSVGPLPAEFHAQITGTFFTFERNVYD